VFAVLSLGLASLSTTAQDENQTEENDPCTVDFASVVDEVGQVCTGIGRDQVCYGNVEVNAVPRESRIDLHFKNPGDSTNVSLIRSLYLSTLDTVNETWGIAQMRLLANLTQATPEEVTLLLFGDVKIEDATEPRVELDIVVNPDYAARIRNTPSLNALVIDVAEPDELVHAVGRLADSSWIRIKEDQYGRVGWVAAELLQRDGVDLESLTVDEANTPYFGSMQAFYFESGSSGACGNMISDGLLIQTPEGVARLTLLINEVSIELLGAESGSTVLLNGNADTGMNINVLNGSANVTVDNTTVLVGTNSAVNVSLGANLTPTGTVTNTTPVNSTTASNVVLLPLINNIVNTLFPGSGGGNRNGRGGERGNRNGNPGVDHRNGNANK
jgi:hypothetical protein